jgi:hypothetical protein
VSGEDAIDPEHEAQLADSVGLALLVVLETLGPAERVAFVLHDMTAARQLASRARRRVRGRASAPETDFTPQREVVDAFLAAARGGDFDALLAVLDPAVVLRVDRAAGPAGGAREVRGAPAVASGALAFSGRARFAQPALVNGAVGIVVAPRGRLLVVLSFSIARGSIVEIDVVADPERLRRLELAVLTD